MYLSILLERYSSIGIWCPIGYNNEFATQIKSESSKEDLCPTHLVER